MAKPHPGSPEACALGCKCAVIDNHHGRGRGGDGERYGWFVSGDCPVHGSTDETREVPHG
jgi:hypothetical protein